MNLPNPNPQMHHPSRLPPLCRRKCKKICLGTNPTSKPEPYTHLRRSPNPNRRAKSSAPSTAPTMGRLQPWALVGVREQSFPISTPTMTGVLPRLPRPPKSGTPPPSNSSRRGRKALSREHPDLIEWTPSTRSEKHATPPFQSQIVSWRHRPHLHPQLLPGHHLQPAPPQSPHPTPPPGRMASRLPNAAIAANKTTSPPDPHRKPPPQSRIPNLDSTESSNLHSPTLKSAPNSNPGFSQTLRARQPPLRFTPRRRPTISSNPGPDF